MNIKSNILTALIVIISLSAIKYFGLIYPIEISTSQRSTEFSIVGEGKIDVTPDTAYVDAGITVNNSRTVELAESTINEVNNKIIANLKALDIEKKDIKTSNYSINPSYTYENGKDKIVGYDGNASVTVKVRDLSKISNVIAQMTAAGANNVQGSRMEVDKPEKFREQARDMAIENAKAQAQTLAKKLGIKLGNITNIVEGSTSMPEMYNYAMKQSSFDMARGAAPANIEPGSQTVSSVVTLYFEKL